MPNLIILVLIVFSLYFIFRIVIYFCEKIYLKDEKPSKNTLNDLMNGKCVSCSSCCNEYCYEKQENESK